MSACKDTLADDIKRKFLKLQTQILLVWASYHTRRLGLFTCQNASDAGDGLFQSIKTSAGVQYFQRLQRKSLFNPPFLSFSLDFDLKLRMNID